MQRQLLIFYDILKEAIPPTKLVLSILQNNMHGKMQMCKVLRNSNLKCRRNCNYMYNIFHVII